MNQGVASAAAFTCLQVERAKLENAVEEELAAEAAADEAAKQQKREQIAAEERRLQELEEQRQAEVSNWGFVVGYYRVWGIVPCSPGSVSVSVVHLRLGPAPIWPWPLLACWAVRGGRDWIVCRMCCLLLLLSRLQESAAAVAREEEERRRHEAHLKKLQEELEAKKEEERR